MHHFRKDTIIKASENPSSGIFVASAGAAAADGPIPAGEVLMVLGFGYGTYTAITWVAEGVRPYQTWTNTNIRRISIPKPPLVKQNIEARKKDLEYIDFIADKYGIDRDVLSDEVHREKQSVGRKGKEISKEQIKEIAKEIKDNQDAQDDDDN